MPTRVTTINVNELGFASSAQSAAAAAIAASKRATNAATVRTTAGTAAAYTLTAAETITGYATGDRFTILPHAMNTPGPATINIDGQGARDLKKRNETGALEDLELGDLRIGFHAEIIYNGTNFELLTPWITRNYLDPFALVPAGFVIPFMLNTPPAGWLECNGAAISRTVYEYLFSTIGTAYGPGDGSTTFNIPDLRGEFLRGRANGQSNDPDRLTRTNRGDGTTGDNVGTKQAYAMKRVQGQFDVRVLDNGNSVVNTPTGPYSRDTGGGSSAQPITRSGSSLNQDELLFDNNAVGNTSSESRPRNVSVLFCIRY